jgi:hypothetical protein
MYILFKSIFFNNSINLLYKNYKIFLVFFYVILAEFPSFLLEGSVLKKNEVVCQ